MESMNAGGVQVMPIKKVIVPFVCQRCAYLWKSRVKTPKACPACKSYRWQKFSEENQESSKTTPKQ